MRFREIDDLPKQNTDPLWIFAAETIWEKAMPVLQLCRLSLMMFVGCSFFGPISGAPAQEPAKDSSEKAMKEPAKTPAIEFVIDTSDVPEMADWADKAKKACQDTYPMILQHLGGEDFDPPKKVKIVYKKMKGVAYTAGSAITCSAAWFTDHPDDVGAVIHELCHVVQRYRAKPPPGWVTEGIADYVRWFQFEPANRRPRLQHPDKAKYTDSYQTTAAFFDWIVKQKDPQFIVKLNAAARRGKYKDELFEELAGKPLDELWSEFIKTQKR
jgi:hypothetical protein